LYGHWKFFYNVSKKDIQEKVLALLNTAGLDVADSDLFLQAIGTYVEKNVDFIDAYSVAWILTNDVNTVCTFDQKHSSRFKGIVTEAP
jgi:predicted nucleic-acid-binding protein